MNPRKTGLFREELFKFIKVQEDIRYRVYVCSQNVPTIGVGYALLERVGKSYRIRSGLEADLTEVGATLSTKDKERLSDLCKMLNDGTIKNALNGSSLKDPFDLTIDKEQAKQLFWKVLPQYDADLRTKLGVKLYRDLQNTKEMVALLSLDFNAPGLIGPGLVNAVRVGNRAEVQYQILYGSNAKRDIGLDNRRKHEAAEFGRYDNETPTAEELKAEAQARTVHAKQIAAYQSEIDAKRKSVSAKRAKGTKTALNAGRKPHKPGNAPNQHAVSHRISQSKARPQNQGHGIVQRVKDFFQGGDSVIHRTWKEEPAGLDLYHYHKRWS
ncbi:hypothetical protein L4X63_21215 [Geomonas sp. Red32]|uniref:hypothetical protein n=1 Tax=Geomonas sp. Red32 TaxID=2912856 RepID=UPI00202CFF33|nr:hypothetical protein [Geomonas sp. Red32]MCM0084106.1 hypothetical protein [Geomonas sp. Red32]